MVVVLPAPFGPTKPNIWPGATEKDTPSSAVMSPKRRVRPESSSTLSVVASGRPGKGAVDRTPTVPVARNGPIRPTGPATMPAKGPVWRQ
jgi:hypothetical protein